MELRDKVVVITGGSGGIGKAMAEAFLSEGATGIMLADLDAQAVAGAAADIGCDGMACDVTDEAQVAALVAATEAKYGRVDVFCSNAGAGGNGLYVLAGSGNCMSCPSVCGAPDYPEPGYLLKGRRPTAGCLPRSPR